MPYTYDLFFSYAWSDLAQAEVVRKALADAGFKIWFDRTEIQDFESITESISKGLSNSKALIAYYSKTYPRRRACQWELTSAFLAGQREGNPRKRVLIINPEEGSLHIHPIELRDALYRKRPTTDAAEMSLLVSSVSRHLSGLNGILGAVSYPPTPPWHGARPVGSRRFVGRFEEMWAVHSHLHAQESVVVTGAMAPGRAQIRGLAGIGKSLLAEEYAIRFGAGFPGGVFWTRGFGYDPHKRLQTAEQLEQERGAQLRGVAASLGLQTAGDELQLVEARIASVLGQKGLPCLWVVDDVPTGLAAGELKKWFAPHPLAKTLITTRSREYHSLVSPVELSSLPEGDAIELLALHCKPEGREETEAAKEVARELGFHALAIDVAGSAIAAAKGVLNFQLFLKEIKNPDQDSLELAQELSVELPNGHERSIAATVLRSVRQLGSEGMDALRLASVLAPLPIPSRLILGAFRWADGTTEEETRKRVSQALSQAEKLSLIDQVGKEGSLRAVHTLVSRTIRFYDRETIRRAKLTEGVMAFAVSDLGGIANPKVRPELDFVAAHGRQLVIRETSSPLLVELIASLAHFELISGAYPSAEALYRQQLSTAEGVYGAGHPKVLEANHNLAVALKRGGKYPEARRLLEASVRELTKAKGKDASLTLTCRANLADLMRAEGDYRGAKSEEEELLEAHHRVFGPDSWETAHVAMNLSVTLLALGDQLRAKELLESARRVLEAKLGLKDPHTMTAIDNLGATEKALGNLQQAKELHQQAYDLRLGVLGEEHPDTVTSLNNLADVLSDLGEAKKSTELFATAHTRLVAKLGEDHPLSLGALNNVAESYRASGEFTKARELHETILSLRLKQLPASHPDVLFTKNNLAPLLTDDLERAEAMQREVLDLRRQTLGTKHSLTLMSIGNLAITLANRGRLNEAIALQDELVAAHQANNGIDHDSTLVALNDLGELLRGNGQYSRAREVRESLLDISARKLGTTHSKTTVAAWNLLVVLDQIPDQGSGRAIARKYLQWLVNADQSTLSKEQVEIRGNLMRLSE